MTLSGDVRLLGLHPLPATHSSGEQGGEAQDVRGPVSTSRPEDFPSACLRLRHDGVVHEEQLKLNQKLQGHYAYYGITENVLLPGGLVSSSGAANLRQPWLNRRTSGTESHAGNHGYVCSSGIRWRRLVLSVRQCYAVNLLPLPNRMRYMCARYGPVGTLGGIIAQGQLHDAF